MSVPSPSAGEARRRRPPAARARDRPERRRIRRRERRAAGPQPPLDPAHHRRADARHAARCARPDHRRLPRCRPSSVTSRRLAYRLGHHRVPAGHHCVDAAVGKARRPVRPEDLLPGRDRDLPGGLDPVRPQPLHGRAHRVPRDPGPGQRRPDGRRPGDRRRHRLAPRARPLRRPVRRRLRRLEHRRPAAWRRFRGRPDLAVDLLHQRADRRSSRSSSSPARCRASSAGCTTSSTTSAPSCWPWRRRRSSC